jgi:DNA-directed RNA polymerase
MKLFLSITLFALVACVSTNNTPEGVLQDFVEARIGKIIDKEFVTERVTGKMLQSFENMSDEDFSKFSDMSNVKSFQNLVQIKSVSLLTQLDT